MNAQPKAPLRKALLRPQLWLEGERRVVAGVSTLVALLMWILSHSHGMLVAVPVCVVIWSVGIWIARELAKHDPFAIDVWARSRRYKPFYPAAAKHGSFTSQVKDVKV